MKLCTRWPVNYAVRDQYVSTESPLVFVEQLSADYKKQLHNNLEHVFWNTDTGQSRT